MDGTMLKSIRNALVDPKLIGIDQDEDTRIELHNEILSSKKMMKNVYKEFYTECLNTADRYFCENGNELEIGSGVSFFKKLRPALITSDIVPAKHLDMVLNAQEMHQIESASLRSIYALNVLHHLEKPRSFFSELERVLKPGGGCVLIEPFHGTIAQAFYRKLHASEHFNPSQKSWESTQAMGAMSNANQALSYIIFVRDRAHFEKEFPNLEIVRIDPLHNYLRHLCSGGLNFKQLLPSFCEPLLRGLEFTLRPLSNHIALQYLIGIRRKVC